MSENQEAEPTAHNIVTLRLPAAWYAVLIGELEAASNLYGSLGGHDPQNAMALWKMCLSQGGATVVEGTEPAKMRTGCVPPPPKPESPPNRAFAEGQKVRPAAPALRNLKEDRISEVGPNPRKRLWWPS
jgi:hypothetical protein